MAAMALGLENPILGMVQVHSARMDKQMEQLEKTHQLFEAETDVPDDADSDRGFDSGDDVIGSAEGPEEKSAQRGLLSSKVVKRSLASAQKLLSENQEVQMEQPPVPMDKLNELAKNPAMLEREMQQNPTLFYEIYSWTQRVISMVYDAMKSVMASAIRRMHDLAIAMTDSAADLRDLDLFKNEIHGVMGKFLGMAEDMKIKLKQLKADLLKMTKETGIVELRKGKDAIVLQNRLHDMMKSLKRVREDFLGSIKAQWVALEDKQKEAIEKQRKELENVREKKPSIMDKFKNKDFLGAITGGGGVLVIGVLVVGLLAGLSVVAAPLLIGIASAFAVAGACAAGFGAIVGRNMGSAEASLKDQVQLVADATKDIGITIGVMKNSIELVSDSLSTLADTFDNVSKKITKELTQFDEIKDQILAFSLEDWCDHSKVRALKKLLPEDDEMEDLDGDLVKIDLKLILEGIDSALVHIDGFIGHIHEQMAVMKPARK